MEYALLASPLPLRYVVTTQTVLHKEINERKASALGVHRKRVLQKKRSGVFGQRTCSFKFENICTSVMISIKSFTIGNFVEITIKPFKRS